MAPDGSGQSPLTDDPLATGAVTWSPDGDRLAFLRYRVDPTGVWDLVTMRPDGSERRVLKRLGDGSGWGVDWSPDGRLVVFDEVGPGPDDGFQVFVMRSRGGTATMLTHREVASTQPAWSPDGQRIAFQAETEQASHVYTMGTDGSNMKVLTPAGEDQHGSG